MTNALRDSISVLAATFATNVVAALRGASLQDILDLAHDAGAGARGGTPSATPAVPAPPRRRTRATAAKKPAPTLTAPKAAEAPASAAKSVPAAKAAPRREDAPLARRSPADIAKVLGRVVELVKSEKGGLRSEQIRERLGLLRKEVPRVLKDGLAKGVLKSKGVKRSTVYTAA